MVADPDFLVGYKELYTACFCSLVAFKSVINTSEYIKLLFCALFLLIDFVT